MAQYRDQADAGISSVSISACVEALYLGPLIVAWLIRCSTLFTTSVESVIVTASAFSSMWVTLVVPGMAWMYPAFCNNQARAS